MRLGSRTPVLILPALLVFAVSCQEEDDPLGEHLDVCTHEDMGGRPVITELLYDHDHCGACGNACGKYNVCDHGVCRASREIPLWPIPKLPLTSDHYEVGDEAVLDRVTGLEWQRHVEERVPWEMASTYCDGLELAGGGWRLPTRIELQSIVDFTKRLPAMNDEVFPVPEDAPPWGSTRPDPFYCPEEIAEPWPNLVFKHRLFPPDYDCESSAANPITCDSAGASIDFMEGTQRYYDINAGEMHDCTPVDQFVRCVRGGPETDAVVQRYEIEDGAALDVYTGLRWQRVLPECPTWDSCEQPLESLEQAQAYCEQLVVDGYDDFRVPDVTELLSLTYPWEGLVECRTGEVQSQWMDGDVFCEDLDDTDLDFYSATPYARSAEIDGVRPWIVRLDDRRSATYEIGARRVRCVRTED